jgi:hypothetical protein
MPRRERTRRFVSALAELVAMMLVLSAVGAALGIGISALSRDSETATPEVDGGTTSSATATATATATIASARSIAKSAAVNPVVYLRVKVLDARLFTDDAPSGTQEQPARMTVRIRVSNPGSERVTVDAPVLAVGSVRIPTDPGAERVGSRFDPFPAGAQQTVTLRYALAGKATPKVVRDRRARLLIAGRSVTTTVSVRGPAGSRLREQISVG